MKRIYYLIVFLMVTMSVSARDRLYINDFSIAPGESKTISVLLANDTAYSALQTDIILPEGLTIDTDDGEYIVDLTSRKAPDHVVSTNHLSDGSIRVIVTSTNLYPFNGSSGALLTIDITASQSFVKGNITLHNSVLVEGNGIQHLFSDELTKVNGGNNVPGDVNGDGKVTSVDITALYNWLLDSNDSAIVNGDQSGDGRITAADITVVYNVLLCN